MYMSVKQAAELWGSYNCQIGPGPRLTIFSS